MEFRGLIRVKGHDSPLKIEIMDRLPMLSVSVWIDDQTFENSPLYTFKQ